MKATNYGDAIYDCNLYLTFCFYIIPFTTRFIMFYRVFLFQLLKLIYAVDKLNEIHSLMMLQQWFVTRVIAVFVEVHEMEFESTYRATWRNPACKFILHHYCLTWQLSDRSI